MKKYIIIGLLSLVTFSLQAQNKVYWKEVIGAKMTSPTSFQTQNQELYILPVGYSVNELVTNEDGGVEAILQNLGNNAILALTAKRADKVIIESDKYIFKKNIEYYIEAKDKGYEINEKFIPAQVSNKDVIKILRQGNRISFWVNEKKMHEIEAEDSHLFPLVAVVVGEKASNVTFLNKKSDELLVKADITHFRANVLGTINITVLNGKAPYTYEWKHTKENISSLKGLNSGTYEVIITDANGKKSNKTFEIDTEVDFGKTNYLFDHFSAKSQPRLLVSGEYISKGKEGKIYWSEADARGNMYIGFTKTEAINNNLKNDLLYSFLLDEDQVHINFEGKIIYSSARTKNLNTLYSITKKNKHIIFTINGKDVVKQKYTQDTSLLPKVILLKNAKLSDIKGDFTGSKPINLQSLLKETTVTTTTYFNKQKLVWLGNKDNSKIAENELPALQDGWIKWYGKSTDIWFESPTQEQFKFDSEIDNNTFEIKRDKNIISFYKNDIFQYAIPSDPNQSLLVKSTLDEVEAEASFGRCGNGSFGPTNKWYFGSYAGISFETNPPSALENGITQTREGTGVISDENGEVLFYTDGLRVFTKNHTIMINGDGLLGNTSATQKGLIVPDPKIYPNGEKRYYIFYSTDVDNSPVQMYYAIVEFTSPTDLGRVIEKNRLLHAASSRLDERVTAVRHATLNAYWIITRKQHTSPNEYQSYLLSENGLAVDPVISTVGLGDDDLPAIAASYPLNDPNRPAPGFIGQIKLSPNSKWLAVANLRRDRNSSLQVFPFDANTGQVGNAKFTALAGYGLFQGIYGIEFSPDGRYLYAADMFCNNDKIFKYDLNSFDNTTFLNSRITLPYSAYNAVDINGNVVIPNINPLDCIGALQLGPDGKIYVARHFEQEQFNRGLLPSQIAVGRIDPETDSYEKLAVPMSQNAIPQGGTSRLTKWGLPTFVQSFLPCADFYFGDDIVVAPGQTSVDISFPNGFVATPTSYLWSTGETTPTITVTTSGTYSLTITYGDPTCGKECTVSDDIRVTFDSNSGELCEEPLEITDIYSCNSYTLTAADGFQNYEWNSGETGRSIVVQNAGEYVVTAFDPILNCLRKGVFYVSFNEFCYDEEQIRSSTTAYNEVLSVSVVNYSDIWLKNTTSSTSNNPFLNAQKGVWRADASFAYMQDRSASSEVDISKDGSFPLYMLDPKLNGNIYPNSWKKVATLEQYNSEGFEVENRDILGRYSSALYGYQNQLSTAVATNAKYHEIVFEGFEEYTTDNFRNHSLLTESNLDVFGMLPNVGLGVHVPLYRHYNVAWGSSSEAVLETSTGRDINNLINNNVSSNPEITLKVVPISGETPRLVKVNIDGNRNIFNLTPSGIRLSKADFSFSDESLPNKWKGNLSVKIDNNQLRPIPANLSTVSINVVENYGHTGKKSLEVNQNISYEQIRFDPAPGRQYIVSMWVSVKNADVPTFASDEEISQTENRRGIKIKFEGSTEEFFFEPTGRIIEGWQRIEGVFCVPQQYDKLYLTFQTGNETTYFDDIRFHPFNGNLQTYVYDPDNYLLRAVLDRNNFATFYYYDSEQQLRLVKKETERGVKTIQEVISNMPTKEN